MQRREAVKIFTAVFGASLAVPETVFARLAEPMDLGIKPTLLSGKQRKTLAAVAQCIIPKTDTPGAIEAGVPRWFETLLQDCYKPDAQKVIMDGFTNLDLECKTKHGSTFAKLKMPQQIEILTAMEKAERDAKVRGGFIRATKDLVKSCYANSEVGASTTFEYQIAPGRWSGEELYKMGDKIYL
ncbi:gluconate 2-dehydrogenase subunit 3 family protein [Haliscomenobacter sp.]|uniref:gluconate 2-dehydrogenase subunit 3 family protein n=1 Tax=Haliscomenobacter sp. TaxID=2717303 RepID=UPI0035936747